MLEFLATSPIAKLPTEIAYLMLAVLLLAVHITVQAILLTRQLGSTYNASARDEQREVTGVAARAGRALRNFLETFPAFIALAVVQTLMDKGGDVWSGAGAAIYFWARLAYLPLYLAGIPYVRSLVYTIACVGLVMMFWRIVF